MPTPLDWTAVERAIRAWVKRATGYANGNVIWESQDGPRPTRPFVTLALQVIGEVGLDGLYTATDLSRPAGQEVQLFGGGLREIVVRLQFFTAGANSAAAARIIATKTRNALRLPSNRDPLHTAGVSPFDQSDVRDLSAILESDFEGRAIFDARFYVIDGAEEFTGFIQMVEGDSTASGTADGTPNVTPFATHKVVPGEVDIFSASDIEADGDVP